MIFNIFFIFLKTMDRFFQIASQINNKITFKFIKYIVTLPPFHGFFILRPYTEYDFRWLSTSNNNTILVLEVCVYVCACVSTE